MPAFLEKLLLKSGRKKGFSGERLDHYVYGGMNNLGAMHGSKITEKGEEMQRKHDNKVRNKARKVLEKSRKGRS